nr:unnamed protein product [Spirometra erinaceieuropaei]
MGSCALCTRPRYPVGHQPSGRWVIERRDGFKHTKFIISEEYAELPVTRSVAVFGALTKGTTDRGAQFKSALSQALLNLLGFTFLRTRTCHLAANSTTERFRRQLKTALRATEDPANWSDNLLLVLLGPRSALKSDLDCNDFFTLPSDRQARWSLQPLVVLMRFPTILCIVCIHLPGFRLELNRLSLMLKKAWSTALMCLLGMTVCRNVKTCRLPPGGKEDVISIDLVKAAATEVPPDLPQGHNCAEPLPRAAPTPLPRAPPPSIISAPISQPSSFPITPQPPTLTLPTPLAFAPLVAAAESTFPTVLALERFNILLTFSVVFTLASSLGWGSTNSNVNSDSHCGLAFTLHIDIASHLRVQLSVPGEPVPPPFRLTCRTVTGDSDMRAAIITGLVSLFKTSLPQGHLALPASRSRRADLKPVDQLRPEHNCVLTVSQLPMRHLKASPPATSKASHWDTTPRQMQHTLTGHHLSLAHEPTKAAATTISQGPSGMAGRSQHQPWLGQWPLPPERTTRGSVHNKALILVPSVFSLRYGICPDNGSAQTAHTHTACRNILSRT